MSSGRTHRLVNTTALIIPLAIGVAWLIGDHSIGKWQSLGALAGGYFFSTMGIYPDLDVGGSVRTFGERGKYWGTFLHYWSMPYGWMFKHRGISHEHMVGTVTRIAVLGIWVIPLFPLLVLGVSWQVVVAYSAWVFLGMTVADSMHIGADGGRRQLEHAE